MHDSGTWMPVGDGAYRAASPAQMARSRNAWRSVSERARQHRRRFRTPPAATRDELLAVFRVAAQTKTPIHVHIRPGVAGLKEALALAAETHAPLHVGTSQPGLAERR